MLTCIACSKHHIPAGSLPELPENDDNVVTPSTKPAIKTLTSQIKDMAVKASGAYKNCKPCSGSSGQDNQDVDSDLNSVSERFYGPYRRAGSSNSTPRLWGKDMEAKMKALSTGSTTPAASVSGRTESTLFVEEDEPKEWVAQVEPGVLITFISSRQGGNDLRKIRFSREIFNKCQAQRWWAENYDRVMELYNVERFNHHAEPLSKDEVKKDQLPRYFHHLTGIRCSSSDSLERHHHEPDGLNSTSKLSNISAAKTETSSVDLSARSSSSRDLDHSGELSVSNASDLESVWVEQDEPGVYITVRALPNGARELRRVRFSRERFGEMHARMWWEENKARIQQQYL